MGKTTYYPTVSRIDKLTTKEQLDLFFDLINAFSIVKSPTDTALLVQDLFTASEIKNLAKRLRIAKLLLKDKNQRDISSELGCSIVTVTKVNHWLNEGGEGFKNVIRKLPGRYNFPKKLPTGPIEYHLPQIVLSLTQYSLANDEQNKLIKFSESITKKEALDRELKEMFSEEFKKRKK